MSTGNRFAVLFSVSVALLLLAACGAAQPTATMVPPTEPPVTLTDTPPAAENTNTGITVTFEGDQCVYHGPERVPAGQIPMTLDVRDQSAHEGYAVGAFTLDEGKTGEDLQASDGTHTPLWAHFHGIVEAAPGSKQETTIILFEGPLYLGCQTSSPLVNVSTLGPIEIEPRVKQ